MTTERALIAKKLFDGENWQTGKALLLDAEGVVSGLIPVGEVPSGIMVETLDDGFLAPGFVDLQVNGGGGALFNNDPSVEGIKKICSAHAAYGVTALLPTLITDTDAVRVAAIAAGAEAARQNVPGFAGLHLEGPHLSLPKKGAHDPKLIRAMTDDDVALLISARKKLPILVVTVAPESATPEQVKKLVAGGVKVSIGHTNSTAADVAALAEAGATLITHLFNAMSPFTGREPGVVGAALNIGSLDVGLICDGYHVDVGSMALAVRAKQGPGKVFLVSDAMSTVGTNVTEIVLNDRVIKRAEGRLTLEDGTLAGADLELATAVRVLTQKVGVDLGEALRMASLYPARAGGLPHGGTIEKGVPADLVWLGDDLMPKKTLIGGKAVGA